MKIRAAQLIEGSINESQLKYLKNEQNVYTRRQNITKTENQNKLIVEKKKMEYTYYNYVNYAENYEATKEKVFMKVE